jgi:phosphatidylglycerol---prolipoprotein diacylglyceryl transferase
MIWNFDPVAFSLLGLDVRWYGLVYIFGFFLTLLWGHRIQANLLQDKKLTKDQFENLLFGMFICGVAGGRIGEFLFYSPETFVTNPLEILKMWHGGMSIHGGILGAVAFGLFYTRKHNVPLLRILDAVVIPLAVTLIFGRLANFINGELVGRMTQTDWGMIFPHIDNALRHPSQLYEAGKNVLLSGFLFLLLKRGYGEYKGILTTGFLSGYGILRFVIEFFREPSGMVWFFTTGQALCLVMIVFALLLAKSQNFWHNSIRKPSSQ